MLCTLRVEGNSVEEKEKRMSGLLQESIQSALRKGDFYTKYNRTQYLIMLPGISQENCHLVSDRIDRSFRRRAGNVSGVTLDYYVASVAEVCSESGNPDKLFSGAAKRMKEKEKMQKNSGRKS